MSDWFVSWFAGLTIWAGLSLIFTILGLLSVPSVLLQRRARPLAATIWLLLLLLAPMVGVLFWWLIGRSHLERKRRRKRKAHAEVHRKLAALQKSLDGEPTPAPVEAPPRLAERRLILDYPSGAVPTRGLSKVQVLIDAEEAYAALEQAIRMAIHHVHFQFYIFQADETGRRFRDLLAERAQAGVEVRVLYDAIGGAPVHGAFTDPLREAGAEVAAFLPVDFLRRSININFRNHRKIVVVDGRVAFTGGLNIGDEYTREWHDIGLQLEGPVVDQLQEVFVEDWEFATRRDLVARRYFARYRDEPPVPVPEPAWRWPAEHARCRIVASGPDKVENLMHEAVFNSMVSAESRIWIATPYFIPDMAISTALKNAARRGVDVRLVLPRRSDVRLAQLAGRSYYAELLATGVKIWEYDGAILHAKIAIFDQDWSVVGSANVDIRSFRLNFEASCFMHGTALTAVLAAQLEQDIERSVPITLKTLRDLSRWTQLQEAAAHLFSPLL